jgi:hypothetical protein
VDCGRKIVADCVFQIAAGVMIWFQTAKRLVISVRHSGALIRSQRDLRHRAVTGSGGRRCSGWPNAAVPGRQQGGGCWRCHGRREPNGKQQLTPSEPTVTVTAGREDGHVVLLRPEPVRNGIEPSPRTPAATRSAASSTTSRRRSSVSSPKPRGTPGGQQDQPLLVLGHRGGELGQLGQAGRSDLCAPAWWSRRRG